MAWLYILGGSYRALSVPAKLGRFDWGGGEGGEATEWKPSITDGCLVYITLKVWSRYTTQGFTYTFNFPTTAKTFKRVSL